MAITRLILRPGLVRQLLCRSVATPTNIGSAHYTELLPIVPKASCPLPRSFLFLSSSLSFFLYNLLAIVSLFVGV